MRPWDDARGFGQAFELVGVLDEGWLDAELIALIREAKQYMEAFDESYLRQAQACLERRIERYIEENADSAANFAVVAHTDAFVWFFGYEVSLEVEKINQTCEERLRHKERDPEAIHEWRCEETRRAMSRHLGSIPVDELLERTFKDPPFEDVFDFSMSLGQPELYATLALCVLAAEISVENRENHVAVATALEAAKLLSDARVRLESGREVAKTKRRAQEERRRGGKQRHAGHERLNEFVRQAYAPGDYKSRRQAAIELTPVVNAFAKKEGIPPLSDDSGWNTVYKWIREIDPGNQV